MGDDKGVSVDRRPPDARLPVIATTDHGKQDRAASDPSSMPSAVLAPPPPSPPSPSAAVSAPGISPTSTAITPSSLLVRVRLPELLTNHNRTEEEEDREEGSGGDSARRAVGRKRRRSPSPRPHADVIGGGDGDGAITPKPRKPSYRVQKEEKESLEEELRLLHARLELLRERVGIPTDRDRRSVTQTREDNALLGDSIHQQLVRLGGVQSMLARHFHTLPERPVQVFIHLSQDMDGRRATLRGLRELKLRRALEYTTERLRYVDETRPYVVEERYVTDDGAYHCVRNEIKQFDGLESVKQLYDALSYYISNIEISVSETLGHLTIREDMNGLDTTVWNHRLVSETDGGIVHELNSVGFSEYYEQFGPFGGAECGVMTADTVDVDDLYPYMPQERIRKDIISTTVLSSYRRPVTHELVVVMKRCVFLTIHKPAFALPPGFLEDMHSNVTTWCSVMAKFLKNHLYNPNNRGATAPTTDQGGGADADDDGDGLDTVDLDLCG